MMNWMSRVLVATGVCVMTSVTWGAPVAAQQSPSPAVDKNAIVLIPGVLTGPGIAALNDLQSASSKAIATMATACKAEMPTTTKAGLEMMDNRLQIMSQAVKTLRPAFDAFYASLDRQQQQRLDVFGPRHRGWRW
jgi:hypothetical protein